MYICALSQKERSAKEGKDGSTQADLIEDLSHRFDGIWYSMCRNHNIIFMGTAAKSPTAWLLKHQFIPQNGRQNVGFLALYTKITPTMQIHSIARQLSSNGASITIKS